MAFKIAVILGLMAYEQIVFGQIRARTELQFPNPPGYVTLKCDFHIHTVFSDGKVWPSVRVEEAWRDGLDAIAITDHIENNPSKMFVGGDDNSSFEIAKPYAEKYNIILVRGGETSRDMPPGHFNALFLNDVNALDKKDYMDAFEPAKKQGAFLIGFNLSNSVDCQTLELSSEIRRKLGLEENVRIDHHITETWKSIVKQPYIRRCDLLEVASRVPNISAKHEGGDPDIEQTREHPSDVLDYFRNKEEIVSCGDRTVWSGIIWTSMIRLMGLPSH